MSPIAKLGVVTAEKGRLPNDSRPPSFHHGVSTEQLWLLFAETMYKAIESSPHHTSAPALTL